VNDVTAILLAAGRSRRMGAFKPLLPFGETTVIEHCLASLHDAGIRKPIVVVGHRAEEIRQALRDLEVSFALNPDPESEMSSSITCALDQVGRDTKAVLIALVDHPAVPPSVIKGLVDEWRAGARLVQPEHQGRGGHPVLVDLRFHAELLSLDPERGLRAFFDAHRAEVRRLPVKSPYVARDMDTWEDYRELHEDVFGTSPQRD
jgi:molybdenum cofactor cytidylyltransferase